MNAPSTAAAAARSAAARGAPRRCEVGGHRLGQVERQRHARVEHRAAARVEQPHLQQRAAARDRRPPPPPPGARRRRATTPLRERAHLKLVGTAEPAAVGDPQRHYHAGGALGGQRLRRCHRQANGASNAGTG